MALWAGENNVDSVDIPKEALELAGLGEFMNEIWREVVSFVKFIDIVLLRSYFPRLIDGDHFFLPLTCFLLMCSMVKLIHVS